MKPQVWRGELLRWYLRRARHPLKDYVVGRYWRWFEKPRLWIEYDGQSSISVCLGDYLQQQIFFHGYYERPLVDWLKTHLTAEDVFWDVGANIGAVTLVAARPFRHVVAFEPDARALALLTRHVAANAFGNVSIIPSALAESSGHAILRAGPAHNLGMSSLRRGADGESVPVVRADDFARDHPAWQPTVIKLDVEGAESLVLSGAPDLLASERLRAIVFEDRVVRGRPASAEIVDRLAPAFRIDELGASAEDAGDGLSNFLATRQGSFTHAS
jgi:FkbM family methyltransferase